ncbi:MAG: hypothetical protein JXB29_11285 [Sedimentisphaerales bacterium]|nr:hypothetical protein [Sedimentisphaerales bacterium]
MESSRLQELEQIPGVGKTIAQDIQNIGINSIDDLKGTQAEQLYDRLCEFKASPVDRCMLFRIPRPRVPELNNSPCPQVAGKQLRLLRFHPSPFGTTMQQVTEDRSLAMTKSGFGGWVMRER